MKQDIADRLEILEGQRAEAKQLRKQARRAHRNNEAELLNTSVSPITASTSVTRKMQRTGWIHCQNSTEQNNTTSCCSEVSISPLFRWPNLVCHFSITVEITITIFL